MKNFAFFGTPRFAEIFLSGILHRGFTPSFVVANPDRVAGRKKELTPPPTKILAQKYGLPVLQPEKLSEKFQTDGAEFGVVAAYGSIIPRSAIVAFPKGIIGVHPSLLPELRGATPIQSALLEGKKETGISLFLLDEKVDHGSVIDQRQMPIDENDDYVSLEEKLARIGAELFSETIKKYLSGESAPTPQDESKATFTKKFSRKDAFITEDELTRALEGRGAEKVAGKIRAFSAEPGAWTIISPGNRIFVGKSDFHKPTEVKLLACRVENGKLRLTTIQPEGKNPQIL